MKASINQLQGALSKDIKNIRIAHGKTEEKNEYLFKRNL